MQPQCPLADTSCRWNPRSLRHNHAATMINQLIEPCFCGTIAWRIMWGGLLPARVECDECRAGFNIGQRLRDCGKPAHMHAGRIPR